LKPLFIGLNLLILFTPGLTGVGYAFESVSFSEDMSGVTLEQQSDNDLILNVRVGKIDFVPVHTIEGDFVMPVVDGFSRSQNFGEPYLPMVHKLLSVPFGCELDVEVIKAEYDEVALADYKLSDPIVPSQPPVCMSDDPASLPFIYEREVYARDEFYELPLAATEILDTMRSVHLGRVSFSPVSYNPVGGRLAVGFAGRRHDRTVRRRYGDGFL